jgi:hypothetical protein
MCYSPAMKLTIAIESVLVILLLLLGWAFVANYNVSPKGIQYIYNAPLIAGCYGTTLVWDDYNPITGKGGNNVAPNSPYCMGK